MLLYRWLEEAVKHKGGTKALIYRDTYLSWRGLMHRVDRRASEFQSLGVREGDLVGLMLGNVPDFIILSLALSKIKAAPLPLDPTTGTRELEMLMSQVPIRGLITRPRGGDAQLPTGSETAPPSSVAPPPAKKTQSKGKYLPESRKRLQGTLLSCSIYHTEPNAVPAKEEKMIGAVLVTADSAGDPKPVERTVGNLAAEAQNLCKALEITGDDHTLISIPLFYSFGFSVGLLATLRAGAALYLEDEVAPNKIIKLVREQQITILPGGLDLFDGLAKLPSAKPLTHKPIRFLSVGGGLTGSTLENFYEKYQVRPISCFHSTETGTVSLDLRGQAGETAGKPLADVEVEIKDPEKGKALGANKEGLLWIRSAAVSPLALAKQQTGNRADTPVGAKNKDGWYHTGEKALLDRQGKLVLIGREDDIVRVEGKRVALGEIEACIEGLAKISAAQARLENDPLGGPMVIVRVVLKNKAKLDPEAILDHCAKTLSPHKVPRRIEICKSLREESVSTDDDA